MSFETMQTGITGIKAVSKAMASIADNISNVNTIGFKRSRNLFAEVLSQNLGAGKQVGRGVELSSVTRSFAQGTLTTTESATDMAIDGKGFFLLKNPSTGGQVFSRAGAFSFNKNGILVNPAGFKLQGFKFDSINNIFSSALTDISTAGISSKAKGTSKIKVAANVDARDSVPTTAYVSTNITPSMYNHSASVTIFDTLGNPRAGQILFRKTSTTNTWDWHLAIDGSAISGGTSGQLQEVGTGGQVTFTTSGLLDTETGTSLTINFSGGASSSQAVTIDFGTSITTDGGSGTDGTTQFAIASSTIFMTQDGNGPGSLQDIRVDGDGTISGSFTNGKLEKLAKVALAIFSDPQKLEHKGKSLFGETLDSGPALIGSPGVGELGSIAANSLEAANVDLAAAFVELINLQRSFQANSRAVTTGSALLAETINLGA